MYTFRSHPKTIFVGVELELESCSRVDRDFLETCLRLVRDLSDTF